MACTSGNPRANDDHPSTEPAGSAREADSTRRDGSLVGNVAHDLKNPIASILVNCQYLEEESLSTEARSCVADMRTAAESLNRMVDGLSELFRGRGGGADTRRAPAASTRIDLAEIVDAAASSLQSVAANRAQRIVTTGDRSTTVNGDADALRRVVETLLENALKHAPSRTDVTTLIERRGDTVVLRVRDAGPAVPPSWRHKIFHESVYDGPDVKRTRAARALGLVVGRVIVESMGGQMWVDEAVAEGDGCAFCIELPLA